MKKKKKKASPKKVKRQLDYYYNEHDDNQVEVLRRKRKKRKLKKHIKWLLVIMILGLIVLYLTSPLSRVQSIQINGLHYLTKSQVLEASGISEDSIHAFTYSWMIENKLEELPMVKKVTVHRGLLNGIRINIEESRVIAYCSDNQTLKVIDEKGQSLTVSQDLLKDVQKAPRLLSFTDKALFDEFCRQFALIPEATRTLMSDIVFAPQDPYDKTRVEISMSDGKKVIVRIEDMASELKYYQEILSSQPDACVYDIYGNKVYASPCD